MRACTLRYATTPWQKGHDLSSECHSSRSVRRPNSALRASPEVSAEVWLDPTDLTASVTLEKSSRLCSNSNKLELFAIDLRQLADGALRFGTTQHFPAVFAASEEVPECESGNRISRRGCVVIRHTGSPTYVVGTPKTEVLDGIVLRLAPKTAAEVSYNPPSISLLDLLGRPPPAQDPHQRKRNEFEFKLRGPDLRLTQRDPARLALGM